jgi:Cysteine-rich secretory protein family
MEAMMTRYFMLALFLTSAAANASPPSVNIRLLEAHNVARKAVDAAPLIWSDALANDARGWAQKLAQTGQFEHAPQPKGPSAQGENLWMGTVFAYSPEDMVSAWTAERQYYRRGIFPKVSTTGAWSDVGHYTQMIWHNTTHVGCAIARSEGDEYLVCRYSPPGNWIGQDPQGARAPSKQNIRKKSK